MTSERIRRAIDAIIQAWPDLAADPVYAEQLVLVALRGAGPATPLLDGPDDPKLPRWLIDAVNALPDAHRGVALGFAAAGYVAGRSQR